MEIEAGVMRTVNDTPTMVEFAVHKGKIGGIREVFRFVNDCYLLTQENVPR